MPEREPCNDVAAEYILGGEVSDLFPHPRFGEGQRFVAPSGRNLDVFDGFAMGINGKGVQLLFDISELVPVYKADTVGFEESLNG